MQCTGVPDAAPAPSNLVTKDYDGWNVDDGNVSRSVRAAVV